MKSGQFLLLMLTGALALGGCSAADSDDGGADAGVATPAAAAEDEGQSVSVAITAAMGGEVSSPSGSGKLAIPAGALAADTTITLAVEAASEGSQSSVYSFGPDGTTFLVPATLTIGFDGTVPEGKKAVLAVMADGAWAEIPGSSLAGGTVSGAVSHFSRFTIILVDGEIVVDSECSDVADNFSACGGDPTGTWTIQEVCLSDGSIGADPFNGMCDGSSFVVDVAVTGTVTFADGKITPNTVTESTITMHVPKVCIGGQGCEAIASGEDGWSCDDGGDACDCTKVETKPDDDTDISDYVVEGNDLVSTQNGESKHLPFCIEGRTITISVPSDPGKPAFYYTATK